MCSLCLLPCFCCLQVDGSPQPPPTQSPTMARAAETPICTVAQVDISSPATSAMDSLSRSHQQAPGTRQRHGSLPANAAPPICQPFNFGISSHEHPPMAGLNSGFRPKPVASTCSVTTLNLMTTAANVRPLSPRAVRRRPSKSKVSFKRFAGLFSSRIGLTCWSLAQMFSLIDLFSVLIHCVSRQSG